MIAGSVGGTGPLDRLIDRLQELQELDMGVLAERLQGILIEGNAEGLLAGTDADGNPMAALKDSTYRRGRGGLGPPTIPRYRGSQLIDRFRVEIQPNGPNGFRLKAGWPGVKQVRHLKSGTKHMPARNPAGIRPGTRQKINEAIAEFKREVRSRFDS